MCGSRQSSRQPAEVRPSRSHSGCARGEGALLRSNRVETARGIAGAGIGRQHGWSLCDDDLRHACASSAARLLSWDAGMRIRVRALVCRFEAGTRGDPAGACGCGPILRACGHRWPLPCACAPRGHRSCHQLCSLMVSACASSIVSRTPRTSHRNQGGVRTPPCGSRSTVGRGRSGSSMRGRRFARALAWRCVS